MHLVLGQVPHQGAGGGSNYVVGIPRPVRTLSGTLVRDARSEAADKYFTREDLDDDIYLTYRAGATNKEGLQRPWPRFPDDFAFAQRTDEMNPDQYQCTKVLNVKQAALCVRSGRADIGITWEKRIVPDKTCIEVYNIVDPPEKGYVCVSRAWPQSSDLSFVDNASPSLKDRETCLPWQPSGAQDTSWDDRYMCLVRRDNAGLYTKLLVPACSRVHKCKTQRGDVCAALRESSEELCGIQRLRPGLFSSMAATREGELFCQNWHGKFIDNPEYKGDDKPADNHYEWFLVLISPDLLNGYRLRLTRPECCKNPFGDPCYSRAFGGQVLNDSPDEPKMLFHRLQPVTEEVLSSFISTVGGEGAFGELTKRVAEREEGAREEEEDDGLGEGSIESFIISNPPPRKTRSPELTASETTPEPTVAPPSSESETDTEAVEAELSDSDKAVMTIANLKVFNKEILVGCTDKPIYLKIPMLRNRFQRHDYNDTIYFLDALPEDEFAEVLGRDALSSCEGDMRYPLDNTTALCVFKRATFSKCGDTIYGNPCKKVKQVKAQQLEGLPEGPPLVPKEWIGRFIRGTRGGKDMEEVYKIIAEPGTSFVTKRKVGAHPGMHGCCRIKDTKAGEDSSTAAPTYSCDRDSPLLAEISATKLPHFLERINTDKEEFVCFATSGDWHEIGMGETWVLGCLAVGGACKTGVGSVELCKMECEAIEETELCNAINYYANAAKPSEAYCCLQSCPSPSNPVIRTVKPHEVKGWRKYVNYMGEKAIPAC
ncbi:unnamed protein product [Vitrella brassicaformis CCMP3155]|uniref:Uncharacterized protein n=2 Tax=Vitrella brassicaformis TaxID=1169539 RepID=A0A0G4EP63_VITBC|nr:unnamed protein product [Vitrella brassicaformis CCMP3155]|eukprot:CEL99602.1 unnamed protein product [Vitrella brassicaformis CCMP3155]